MKLQMVENHFLIMLPGDQEYLYQESMQWQRNLFDYKKKMYSIKNKSLEIITKL
jgi:hypothetical protein